MISMDYYKTTSKYPFRRMEVGEELFVKPLPGQDVKHLHNLVASASHMNKKVRLDRPYFKTRITTVDGVEGVLSVRIR